jgi:hypothetical protein
MTTPSSALAASDPIVPAEIQFAEIQFAEIQFFDNYIPAIEADEYTIAVKQTAVATGSTQPLNQTFNALQKLSVVAPRFTLPPEDIQSIFPPANATGIFDQNLAHIVLTQRVLPWERLIDATDGSTKGTPWMALLLFTPDEIVPPANTAAPADLTNSTLASSYPVSSQSGSDSLLTPADKSILGPALTPHPTDEAFCQAIDISCDLFTRVVPRFDELTFLAHVRETGSGLENKSTDQAAGDGWFSVVIGNRFPAAPATGSAAGARNIAHLVSLEGFSKYLKPNPPSWPPGIQSVRLASLQSWSFTCLAEVGDFASLARNLIASPVAAIAVTSPGSGYTDAPNVTILGDGNGATAAAILSTTGTVASILVLDGGSGYTTPPVVTLSGGGGSGATVAATLQMQGGDPLRLRLPVTAKPQPANSPEAAAQNALQRGYTALAYETRVGDKTFGWYRGPFAPNPVAAFSHARPFPSSAAATIYDSATGTFDLTYATAWQTGRMLALAAPAHAATNMAVARSLRLTTNLLRERAKLDPASPAATALSPDPKAISNSVIDWMTSTLAAKLPSPGVPSRPALRTQVAAAPPPTAPAVRLGVLMQSAAFATQVTASFTLAVQQPQVAAAVDWLAGLRLLEGLPFCCLVPNAAMLPAESIRFFYVDPNYLDALCDGANSIGQQTSRDVAQAAALRPALREAAIQATGKLRSRRIATNPRRAATNLRRAAPMKMAAQTATSSDPVAGLLLRSAIVSGWPGLEVKAYTAVLPNSNPLQPDPASLVAPLRMERLAPDVLLCLYPRIPVWIELDEPHESLAFGVEDPAKPGDPPVVALRYLDNANGDMGLTNGTTASLTSGFLRGDSRVLDVAAWQAHLAGVVPKSSTPWSPAAFAIQMVRAPEQIIFQILPNPVPPEGKAHA